MPENQHHDPFDDRITTALREVGNGFETDGAALVAGGRSRGRRAVLRRRAGVLGGVAGIALVGAGGAVLLPTTDSPGPGRFGEASSSSASPTPTAFTDDALLRELKELLPARGKVSEEHARGTERKPGPYARLVYDDGEGAAAIVVSFARVDPDDEQTDELTQCPDRTFSPYDACTPSQLPDGSRLMLFQGYEYPDRRVDTKRWSADLVTPEGQHVSVAEWNAPAQKGAPVSREDPPLTTAQLREVVTAEVWRDVVDAIPERPEPTRSAPSDDTPPPAPSGAKVGETLAGLLPETLEVVERGGQESEFAYVVVDDGRGRSLVQVNVQHGMDDVAGQLYANAETLPDGTLVATRQGPGDDRVAGVVMWTVDTMRAGSDGFRVVISAFNNGAAHADPSRDTPALTMEQLRDIALSPEWEAMR